MMKPAHIDVPQVRRAEAAPPARVAARVAARSLQPCAALRDAGGTDDAVRIRAGALADRSVALSTELMAVRRPAAPALPATYRRRRAFAGAVLAVCTAVGIVIAHDVLVGSGGVPAAAAASQPAIARGEVVALRGDTLWSIAAEYRGGVDIGRFVEELVSLNGGASIQAGQRIILP